MNDIFEILPSRINGKIIAPDSKSEMIRYMIGAMLANGISVIHNSSNLCNDAQVTLDFLKDYGNKIDIDNEKIAINSLHNIRENLTFNCGESALLFRMLSIILSLSDDEIHLRAEGSLKNRNHQQLIDFLDSLGVFAKWDNENSILTIKGPIKSNKIQLDGSSGSQILTGLLFAMPLMNDDSEIIVENLKSKPYIDLSIRILKEFGIIIENINYKIFKIKGNQQFKSGSFQPEGCWSSSANFLVAAAINGNIEIEGLNTNSLQPDRNIIEILKLVGAKIELTEKSIKVENDTLNSFNYNASDTPDLVPPLVALACNCKGTTIISGIDRLKNKESDRASVLIEEFSKLGAKIKRIDNSFEIIGNQLSGRNVISHNDHRIAMALAIAGLNATDSVIIDNIDFISKSYPEFISHFKKLTGAN